MTESTLEAWLAHLETLHPKSIDLGLDRIRTVAERLGVLQPGGPRTITVAGTNGKGSCVATLAHLLDVAGASVGVYTSPHLQHFNERIVVRGEPATDKAILEAFHAIDAVRGEITLSYFEFATLAALWLFRRAGLQWQLLEVGLGGRLDAVNIVDADACVITSIGIDHTEWLGDTRELIAVEKAGVARPQCPAVVAEIDSPSTLRPALEALGARVYERGVEWQLSDDLLTLPEGQTIPLTPHASLQASNLAAAATVLAILGVTFDSAQLSQALAEVKVPGRQQRLMWQGREIWCDVSHNRESVNALTTSLRAQPASGTTHAVFAGMADKPLRDMMDSVAPLVEHWHLSPLEGLPRAASPSDVAAMLSGNNATVYPSIEALTDALLSTTLPGDRVVVFGSFVTVGALLSYFQSHGPSCRITA